VNRFELSFFFQILRENCRFFSKFSALAECFIVHMKVIYCFVSDSFNTKLTFFNNSLCSF